VPEKGGEAKKQAPSKPTQQKPNSKAGWLVGYRADLWNQSTTYKLKLLYLTEGGADQAPATERREKLARPPTT
jgi:hypothetical protein